MTLKSWMCEGQQGFLMRLDLWSFAGVYPSARRRETLATL